MVNPSAAAIDIGSKMHVVAVNSNSTGMPARAFCTFTHDLHDLVDWIRSCAVTSLAKLSTGANWIPTFEIREQYGYNVILVNVQ